MKACKFVNLKTRAVVEARSIRHFCRSVGMNDYRDIIHMYPVLRGERLHHRGWAIVKYMNTRLKLRDIYGNIYEGSLEDLLYGFKIPAHRLWSLMTGKKKVFQGLFLDGTEFNYLVTKPFKIKKYIFNTPNNKEVSGKSVRAVESQIGAARSYHTLSDIARGRFDQSGGYTLKDIILERKSVLDEHPKKPILMLKNKKSWRKTLDVKPNP